MMDEVKFLTMSSDEAVQQIANCVTVLQKKVDRCHTELAEWRSGIKKDKIIEGLRQENAQLKLKDYVETEFGFTADEYKKLKMYGTLHWDNHHSGMMFNYLYSIIPTGADIVKGLYCPVCKKTFLLEEIKEDLKEEEVNEV